jgi:hypothetical protein
MLPMGFQAFGFGKAFVGSRRAPCDQPLHCSCNYVVAICCNFIVAVGRLWRMLLLLTKEEQWSRIMPRANQVAESHQEPHADFRPRKKSAKRERLVKITYVGPMGQRQHRFIRESAIPDFLRTRVQRCS